MSSSRYVLETLLTALAKSTARLTASPQVPANIVLKVSSPKIWLPTLTLCWGIVSTLQGVSQNLSGFFAARFFLGVAESGLFPGVVYYFSMWYKRRERQYRIALFFSAASLAGAFGGIFAYVCARSATFPQRLLTPLSGHWVHERGRRSRRMAVDFHCTSYSSP
jgi:MFS family permease